MGGPLDRLFQATLMLWLGPWKSLGMGYGVSDKHIMFMLISSDLNMYKKLQLFTTSHLFELLVFHVHPSLH